MATKFPKYSLTSEQIRGIANIVRSEQGTIAGMYAEASQIANRTDMKGDKYATGENAVKTVTSGWYADGKSRYKKGTSNKYAIKAVVDVFLKGKRTLPRYIDEHDYISDIKCVKSNGKTFKVSSKNLYKKHETVITNKMGSVYTFYAFPGGYSTGVDPFGYTSEKNRKKYGDFCYTLSQAKDDFYMGNPEHYSGKYPVVPDKSFGVDRTWYEVGDGMDTLKNYTTQIKRVQALVNWVLSRVLEGYVYMTEDGMYGPTTAYRVGQLQKYLGLTVNKKFGKLCLAECKRLKL